MQLATRVDDKQGALFKELTKALRTTPSDALRMFVTSFNLNRGFPCDARLESKPKYEAFASEEEAVDYTTNAMKEALDETWRDLDGLWLDICK